MTGDKHWLARWWRHLWIGQLHVRRAFPDVALARIEQAIGEREKSHRGEVRFAVESSLQSRQLLARLGPRGRALQVFSHFRIWDTEENNGVLLYLLWADHAVEVVADRGAAARIDPAVWKRACRAVSDSFKAGNQVEGVLAAVALLSDALAQAYPAEPGRDNPNELANRPLVL